MTIIKRDGSIVPFDKQKIINAINAAFIEVDGKLYEDDSAKDIANEIEQTLLNYFKTNAADNDDTVATGVETI